MHSYIIHNRLASLYVCFAMLHTTLHNETDIIHQRYQNISIEHRPSIRKTFEENGLHFQKNNVRIQLDTQGSEITIFDMIIPKLNEDILLWPKTENYVVIPYALDPSLRAAQRKAIPAVLRSIEDHTCIRFMADPSACSGDGAKLCFRTGQQRAAHLGRRASGPQPVTLAPGDGSYWALHMVGHVLGLPHPHTCFHGPSSGQEHSRNATRPGCVSHHCPWRRFDPGSALHLTAEELGGWRPPHLNSASALLALWRTRRTGRLSHWDSLALHDMYRCDEHRPGCPPRHCRHGGFTDTHCECVCPAGFSGADCGVRVGSGGGDGGGVRHMAVQTELEVTPSGLSELGTAAAGDPSVLRVRTSSQRLRVAVRLDGAEGELSEIPPDRSVVLYSEALLCSIKMYAFQNGSFVRTFCILDYLGETLLLNVADNVVDLLFSLDPSLVDTRQMLERTWLVERSADDSLNITGNATITGNVTTAATSANTTTYTTAAPFKKGRMRSVGGTMPSPDLIILPAILFALMGFNFLAVFCIKKYWEYRYGTAGIYRGNEGDNWADQDEEEPEDWQIKVEYSDSFEGASPIAREMSRADPDHRSCPQSEMTDLELFRSQYGVPGHAPPDTMEDDEEDHLTSPAEMDAVPSDEGDKSDDNLTLKVETSYKMKKRVSFSDDMGKPLHVHSDAALGDGEGTPAPKEPGTPVSKEPGTPVSKEPGTPVSEGTTETQPEAAAGEVHIVVPFTEDIQQIPSADSGDESESDEVSENSSCCDTSSSSSYHEDEDDPKKAEPGLLHGLTRCFRKKPDSEI